MTMKLDWLGSVIPGPAARVAIVSALLAALGVAAIWRGAPTLGVALAATGAAIAAAFVGLVLVPARIPRDATLVIRLEGVLRERAPRSLFERIRSRAFP